MNDSYWIDLVEAVNKLMSVLRQKPEHLKTSCTAHPGSILNGYREGDLSFNVAVELLSNKSDQKEGFWRDQHTELAQEVLRAAGLPDDFKGYGTVHAFQKIKKQQEVLEEIVVALQEYSDEHDGKYAIAPEIIARAEAALAKPKEVAQ